ncbi:MAG: HEAT repeat domain-containing protein [Endomicrobiia bacterium]
MVGSRHLNVGYFICSKLRIIIVIIFLSMISMRSVIGEDIKQKLDGLNSSSTTVVLQAINELAQINTIESTNALVNRLKIEKDNYLKTQIIEALAVHQSTVALDGILSAINDSNPYVRQTAMVNLGYFSDNDKVAESISSALEKETNDSVKLSAINTFSKNRTKKAVDALGKVLKTDKDARVRKFAIRTLGKINTEDALKEVEKYKADPEVRDEVNDVLRKVKKGKPGK